VGEVKKDSSRFANCVTGYHRQLRRHHLWRHVVSRGDDSTDSSSVTHDTIMLPVGDATVIHGPVEVVPVREGLSRRTSMWPGTFSLDTERGQWRIESGQVLQLDSGGSRAVRARARLARWPLRRNPVPELVGEIGMPEWQHVWREALPWECIDFGHSPSRDMVSMAYLGNHMFCISRPVSVPEQTPNGPVETTRFDDREAPS
jgi:hypothetical protein